MERESSRGAFPAPRHPRSRLCFVPSALSAIPPPTLRELRQVYADIDFPGSGRAPAADVLSALDVNALDMDPIDLELAVAEMVRLTGGEGAVVDGDAFCRCLHALSLQQRDLLPAELYAVFPDSSFSSVAGSGRLQLRRSVWLALEDPLSSPAARAVSTVVVAAILLSTVAFCVETLPGVHMRHTVYFYGIEAACVALFTVEFALRAACTPEPRAFFRSALNWVDLAAIVPFYVELGLSATGQDESLGSSAILRAMRLVRVFRMLKVGRYLALMRVFMRTVVLSLAPLFMVAYVITIAALMCSSIEFFAEPPPGADGAAQGRTRYQAGALSPEAEATRLANFSSIPALFWWCIITMTGGAYARICAARAATSAPLLTTTAHTQHHTPCYPPLQWATGTPFPCRGRAAWWPSSPFSRASFSPPCPSLSSPGTFTASTTK